MILSWLQNDGTRGFSVDQLKGKNFHQTEVVPFQLLYRVPPISTSCWLFQLQQPMSTVGPLRSSVTEFSEPLVCAVWQHSVDRCMSLPDEERDVFVHACDWIPHTIIGIHKGIYMQTVNSVHMYT